MLVGKYPHGYTFDIEDEVDSRLCAKLRELGIEAPDADVSMSSGLPLSATFETFLALAKNGSSPSGGVGQNSSSYVTPKAKADPGKKHYIGKFPKGKGKGKGKNSSSSAGQKGAKGK